MTDEKEREVVLADGENAAGFAVLLAGLIRENVESGPRKRVPFDLLSLLRSRIVIEAPDAEVTITLRFGGGKLVIENGEDPKARVRVTTSSEGIFELSQVRVVAGMPWLGDEVGKTILKKLFRREIRARGLVCRPLTMLLFLNLASVK